MSDRPTGLAPSRVVAVLGPTPQGAFLQRLGLRERVAALVAGCGEGAVRARLVGEAERLAHPQAMGGVYHAMALVPAGLAHKQWAGFPR